MLRQTVSWLLIVRRLFSPRRIAHTQWFPLVILSRVWDLLISRLWALISGRFPCPPPPLSIGSSVVSVSSAPEGHIHQALAAGSQLRVGAPAGRGGSGFSAEAKEMEEESDGNLGISGSVSHLQGADSTDLEEKEANMFSPFTFSKNSFNDFLSSSTLLHVEMVSWMT